MLVVLHLLFLLVDVAAEGTNVALNKHTTSSSAHSLPSSVAVDGKPSANWADSSCFAVSSCDLFPWWQVDLQQLYKITEVKVTVRADCCNEMFHDVAVDIYKKDPTSFPDALAEGCGNYNEKGRVAPAGGTETINCGGGQITGRYVRISGLAKKNPGDLLQFCEVQVIGVPVTVPKADLLWSDDTAMLASSMYSQPPSKGMDGNESPFWASGSCFATATCDRFPWWQIDLRGSYCITEVKVILRADCCYERFADIVVQTFDMNAALAPGSQAKICTVYKNQVPTAGETVSLVCDVPVPGSYLRLSANQERLYGNVLQFCEIKIYGYSNPTGNFMTGCSL